MPATPDEPVYYRTHVDIDTLHALDDFNDHDAVHVITPDPVDPLSDDATAEGLETAAARASAEELTEWGNAYDTLKQRAAAATRMLAIAQAKWETDRDAALTELRAAYAEYEHVHDTIERRHDEVDELRDKATAEAEAAEQARLDAAQAAEDAELGPRGWVIHALTPDLYNSYDHNKKPDMFIPTIHVAGCPVTKGREEDTTGYREWQYARVGAVAETLHAKGPLAKNACLTGELAPVKLCGRCKPEASLRAAGIGDAVDAWQAQVDAIQPPMPADRLIPKQLGLQDEWASRYQEKDGYIIVSYETYRKEGCITADEILIGWLDATLNSVSESDEAVAMQNRLAEILPDRGFAVRRFNEPKRLRTDERESRAAVAVRRMRTGEIRQRQADAAATARYQSGRES